MVDGHIEWEDGAVSWCVVSYKARWVDHGANV